MQRLLFDTTLFVDLLRGNNKAVECFIKNKDDISLSYITYGELLQGVNGREQLQKVEKLIGRCKVLWGKVSIEKKAILLLLEHNFKGIGLFDALIAATALEHNLTLVTHNLKHFKVVENLRVIQPY